MQMIFSMRVMHNSYIISLLQQLWGLLSTTLLGAELECSIVVRLLVSLAVMRCLLYGIMMDLK